MSNLIPLINSDCNSGGVDSITYGPLYGIGPQNNVYERVQQLVNLAVNIGPLDVGFPTFGGEVLPTGLSDVLSTTLERPVHADLTAPASPEFTLPTDLAAPGYVALRRFSDLGHFSPVLTSVQWAEPVAPATLSSQAAPEPDLNYPVDDPQNLPERPVFTDVVTPDITLSEIPDLVRLDPIGFDVENLQPLVLAELPQFNPPEVDEMRYRPLNYYTQDAEYRGFLGEILQRGGPLSEWASSFSYNLLLAQQLRFQRQQIKRGLDEVFETAGARNIEVASGAVDQAAAALLQDRVDESIKASDTVRDEVYRQALELVKQAVSGAITVERYRGAAYIQYVKQNVEIYRLNIQVAKQLLDELTRIVQIVAQDVADQVQVYNLYVEAQMAQAAGSAAAAEFVLADVRNFARKLTMVRSDAQLARAAARIDALAIQQSTMPLRTYRAMLSGVSSQLGVVRNGLTSWGEAIRAHSEYTEAQVRQLDGVDTYASAVTSAVRVNEANVASYRQVLSAEQNRMSAFEQYLSANTAAFDAELNNFRESVQSELRRLEALSGNLRTSAQILDTYRGVAVSAAQHAATVNQSRVAHRAAADSVDATVWDVSMAQQSLSAELVSQYARLDVGRRAIDVQAAAALSQSAASVFQVSLSMSGDSRERVSAQLANSQQISVGRSVQWSKSCSDSVRTTTRPVMDSGT